MSKLEQAALSVPEGYAMVSIDALKAWGKYDEVRNACQFSAEQAEQEPLLWGDDKFAPHERPQKQEPVAIAIVTKTKTDANYITNIDLSIAEAGYKLPSGEHSLYAAPVRTKDLTDDEIDGLILECALMGKHKLILAAIASDREKNK